MFQNWKIIAITVAACGIAAQPSGAQDLQARIVAEQGTEAPGTGGQVFGELSASDAVVLRDGTVVFHHLSRSVNGIWLSRPGSPLELLALQGDILPPELGDGEITHTLPPQTDDQGLVYVLLEYDDREFVLARFDPATGSWLSLWDSQDPLPLPGGVERTQPIPDWRVSTQRDVAIQSWINGPGFPANDAAIWRLTPSPELIVTTRQPIGSVRPMVAHEFGPLRIRPDGAIVLEAESRDQVEFGRVLWDDEGIWSISRDGSFEELARVGDPLPGGSDRAFLSSFNGDLGMTGNRVGQLAYVGTFRNNFGRPKVEGLSVLVADASGEQRRIAAGGDSIPGSTVRSFLSFWWPAVDPSGNVAFSSRVDEALPTDDDGIWFTRPDGSMGEIIRQGGPVPGVPDHTLSNGPYRTWPSAFGDVLFSAPYTPTGTSTRKTGIFIRRPGDSVRPVILRNDHIDLGDGRSEEVALIQPAIPTLPGGPLGETQTFTRGGDLLLSIVPFDGTSMLVLIRVPVSCPADCDLNGTLDFFDFLCFQSAFARGESSADCDHNGRVDLFDFLCFQSAFAEGCQ